LLGLKWALHVPNNTATGGAEAQISVKGIGADPGK
jgi:hypothetical protein